jgi:acyl transferase domain-containing protein
VNAHVILEEFIQPKDAAAVPSGEFLFLLSAQSPAQLKEYASRLLRYLDREPGEAPERIAFTLQTGRESMPERLAVLASGTEELRSKLRSYLDGSSTPCVIAGRAPACSVSMIDLAGSSWSEIASASCNSA